MHIVPAPCNNGCQSRANWPRKLALRIVSVFSLATLVCSLLGCAFLERNTLGLFEDPPPPARTVAARNARRPIRNKPESVSLQQMAAPQKQSAGIELLWSMPSEPVEGFIISFGDNPADLSQQQRVTMAELDKFEDPQHGFVCRYVLSNNRSDGSTFVSVRAFSGDQVSQPSAILEVKP